MNSDIRLSITFLDHPKTLKLERRLGFSGVKALLRLWIWTATTRPSGNLSEMDAEDVEIAAKWDGTPEELTNTLVSLGWLDVKDTGFRIHGWSEHNAYAAHSEQRSAAARAAARARWDKRTHAQGNPDTYTEQCPQHANGIADENPPQCPRQIAGTAPSPSPFPFPSPEERREHISLGSGEPNSSPPGGSDVRRAPKPTHAKAPPCPYTAIVRAYNETLGTVLPQVREITEKRRNAMRARWLDSAGRQNLQWWQEYFAEVGESQFLTGQINAFQASFDWLIKAENLIKVVEGNYRDVAPTGEGPACGMRYAT